MDDHVATDAEERAKQRMKQEVMNRVLAGSIVSQLLSSGCDQGQVIDFATEVLHSVTERKWGPDDKVDATGQLKEIACSAEASEVPGRHVLRGERVLLVPLERRHFRHLEAWREQPHIQDTCSHLLLTELLQEVPPPDADRYDWVVETNAGSPVGLVSLFHVNRAIRKAEIAKLVGDPAALGAGYAHEATCLLLGYAFQTLGMQRVYLRTNGFNLHNIRLNEKIGFRFEGILRASEVLNQDLVDVVLMSMLGREFYRMYRVRELSSRRT